MGYSAKSILLTFIVNQVNIKTMSEERILDQIYYAHKYLNELEHQARDYGTGERLFSSEIHTITAVVDQPNINLTQLAQKMDISKAATSKFTGKMIKRGYLEKQSPLSNKKEVLFIATKKGETAAAGHDLFEKKIFGPLLQIERDLSEKERDTIISYFKKLKKMIRS